MLICAPVQSQTLVKPNNNYGGTLIWGTHTKPTIINPVLTTQSVSMSLLDLIFNGLVRWNTKGKIEPDLAKSWDVSGDGLTYTFYLRKGVKFHDGVECTAFDVKFTYDMLIDPKNNSPFKSSFALVREFKVIDKYTFQIILKKPSVPFIYRLVREIIPKHQLEKTDLKTSSFNSHPIGTGPFKFKKWTKHNQLILEYNPDYYEGRPYLDKIMVKTYPGLRDLWSALMREEVDFALFIEKEDYEVIKNDPAFKAYDIPVDYYYALYYNLNDPILQDKTIRQAIAYGINRKNLIDIVAGGYGLESSGPFHPECFGFNPNVQPVAYNPEKARKILAEAGWFDGDNNGILAKEGTVLQIKVLVDERCDIRRKIAMVIRQHLQRIGIKIKVLLYKDGSILTEEFLQKHKPQAHLKLLVSGIGPDEAVEEWYDKFKRAGKLWAYQNEEIADLSRAGKISQDRKKREQIYQKMHKLIYKDQPACFFYFPVDFHVISAKINNTEKFFNLTMPFYTMKDWRLKKK